MSAQLSLLGPTPTRGEIFSRRKSWYDRIRPEILRMYEGCEITTDEVWGLIRVWPDLRVPDGMSANVMGGLFRGWPAAVDTGCFRRSQRSGANGNLLKVWKIG